MHDNTYSDVTLACEDDQEIEAHKIVLACGSTFFKDIFVKTKHPNPFIYLKGVKKDELQNIIDFMYIGEVSIVKEQLERFLEIAQHFKIKGLEKKEENNAVKTEDLNNVSENTLSIPESVTKCFL